MTRLLEWLLDLDKVGLATGEPISLEWGRSLPAWLVVGLAAIAVLLVFWVYRRERASLRRVVFLTAMRVLLIFLVGAVLCKPLLVWKRVRTEASMVVLLVDNSLSMSAQDAYQDDDEGLRKSIIEGARLNSPKQLEEVSRIDCLRSALTRDDNRPLQGLLTHHRVQLATFSSALTEVTAARQQGRPADIVESLRGLVADGPVTDVSGAITSTIDKWAGSRLAGIVLASDGQATSNRDLRPALELAARKGVPIFPIRIGSEIAPIDVEVSPPRAAAAVLANDVVTVESTLVCRGLTGPTEIELTLVDAHDESEEVVATQRVAVSPEKPDVPVELRTTPSQAGVHEYRVRAGPVPNERITANNTDAVHVRVIDDRVRVLYVEGYPRYEYRYLKNALLRERTAELSVLLLEADDRFVQEGTIPIRHFPETPEELNRYDVVIFGDVDPKAGWLTQAQMIMLLDFVANQGGGFAVIAGERTAPRRFFGTPLEKLLPVLDEPAASGMGATGFRLALTPEGKMNRIFRFAADAGNNDAIIQGLPEMYWALASVRPKPGATILAEVSRSGGEAGSSNKIPLIVSGQYGAGKLFFQATDDTWRWRRHTGEFLHDSYWVQVIRYLMPTSHLSNDGSYAIRTDRRVYGYGDPVHVDVQAADSLLPQSEQEVKLVVDPVGRSEVFGQFSAAGGAPTTLSARRVSLSPDAFETSFVPSAPGSYTIRLAAAFGREHKNSAEAATVRVNAPDLESRRPAANHQALQLIAASTGGRVIALNRLDEGFASIPDRSLIIPDDVEESLWDSKLVLAVFLLIIGTEWGVRKAFGLL